MLLYIPAILPAINDEGSFVVPLILIAAGILFVLWWYLFKMQRKRLLTRIAKELNYEFIEQEKEGIPEELASIPMPEDFYEICRYKVKGKRDDVDVTIFDLTVFEFKISKNFGYTALAFRSPRLCLPLFVLKPRNKMEEQITETRGVQFPNDLEFTSLYRVNGSDWEAVRSALPETFRKQIRNHSEVSLIGHENTLFMHKFPGYLSAREIKECLEEGLELVRELERGPGGIVSQSTKRS